MTENARQNKNGDRTDPLWKEWETNFKLLANKNIKDISMESK
jgi:hypothetical protein